jgi:hypothetical protein
MRYLRCFVFLLFLAFTISTCEKERITIDPDNLIIGTWINSDSECNITRLERSNRLIDNKYGISFKSDSTLIERKNAGWCGTPPIYLTNYDGTWHQVTDTLIRINVGYWGGEISFHIEIESIDKTYLRIIYHYD